VVWKDSLERDIYYITIHNYTHYTLIYIKDLLLAYFRACIVFGFSVQLCIVLGSP